MKIAYFSNQFAQARGHGIARYARHLHGSISTLPGAPELLPVAAWSDRDPASLAELQAGSGLRLLPLGRRMTPLLWTFLGAPRLERFVAGVDVVHALSLGYPVATRRPFVVTVHDIGPLTHPEFFSSSPAWVMRRALQQALRDARAFICVSNATADQLRRYCREQLGTDPGERVVVIHEGVEERFFGGSDARSLRDLPLPAAPFFLTAGAASPRKNLGLVIESLGSLKSDLPHHLVLAGGRGWDAGDLDARIEAAGLEGRVHQLGYVTDPQLRALYGAATAYLHPSLFEGFGLTVLEAMAAGCPVITSNVHSLPEVAGDAALLVDPRSEAELVAAMRTVVEAQGRADSLRRLGVERARQFSWERSAREVVQVYERVSR